MLQTHVAPDMELRVAIAGMGKHHEQRLLLHLLALASRVLLIHRFRACSPIAVAIQK